MGWLQRFISKRLEDDRATKAQAESRKWHLQCPKCGTSKSYWELGAIRYKGFGGGKSPLGHCSTCGKKRFLKTVYIDDDA